MANSRNIELPDWIHTGHYADKLQLLDLQNPLLVTSKSWCNRASYRELIEKLNINETAIISSVESNPDIFYLQSQVDRHRFAAYSEIIALGGGSVIDTAKVLSIFIGNADYLSLKDLLVNPDAYKLKKCLPLIAIPTTSGTGAECTPFATVWDKSSKKKYSLESNNLRPSHVILDYTLTSSVPDDLLVTCGLDAISHAFESIWNKRSMSFSSSFASHAIQRAFRALPRLLDSRESKELKEMQLASTLSGLAIASTRTGLAHAVSYPLTSHYGLPHGLAASFILNSLLRYNLLMYEGRFRELFDLLGVSSSEELSVYLKDFLIRIGYRDYLSKYLPSDLPEIVTICTTDLNPKRANNNFVDISKDDLRRIVADSYNEWLA